MKRITLALPAPYVGLRPFTENEALLFFGRDAHVRDLLAKLECKRRFLAVLGASGTGKSSLVRAGLIPALHRGALHPPGSDRATSASSQQWNVCIFTPGDSPMARLAHALTQDSRWVDSANGAAAESALGALLGASPLALAELYRQKAALFGGQALLLVVDQFEEILRYRQRNPDEADSFVKLLLRSAGEDVPIYVAMTMRSDFLGSAVAFHGLAEAINSGIYLTPRLAIEQIRSVIRSPLLLVGGDIDPVLANRLVNTLAGEDELPVLQHALLRMWNHARSLGRSTIEAEDFEVICAPRERQGDPMLPLAIDNHASEIHEALTPLQRGIARRLLLSLVERRDGGDVRRPQSLHELQCQIGDHAKETLTSVIEVFRAHGFLLPAAGQLIGPDDLIDISHESFIRRWRLFQSWLSEEGLDAAELREWLQRAERRRAGGGWLDERDCDRAERWRARVNERSNPIPWAMRYAGPGSYERVDNYIRASLERARAARAEREALRRQAEEERVKRLEVEAQLQREAAARAAAEQVRAEKDRAEALIMAAVNRRRSRIAIAGGLAALVLAMVAVLFWLQARQALDQAHVATQRAEALARTAQAGELASTAENLARDFPDRSLLLALEARRIDPIPKANAILRAANAMYPYRAVLRGHEGVVGSARFAADGRTVLTSSLDKTVRLWDVVSGKELRALRGHEGDVVSARFAADGRTVLTASSDKTARLWDVASGKELRALRGHEGGLTSARFSADGKTVLTASFDQTARLWDVSSGKELRTLRGHEGEVISARFSADGQTVLTASWDKTARLWDVSSGKELRTLRGHEEPVSGARLSADGNTVLTASWDRTARLWDVASGKELRVLRGDEGLVTDARFSVDGNTVLTSSFDKTARLWDVASGRELRALRGHEGEVSSARFSADGKTVLTASSDKTARLWDVTSGKELRALRGHEDAVSSARFSNDGKTVFTASSDTTARLWDMASGKELLALRGHEGEVTSARFSGDGKMVLTPSWDKSARLWDVASGKELRVLRGHEGPVNSARFSADGKVVLTASSDHTARLWDVASGKELRALRGHEGPVSSARFSAEGTIALTESGDRSSTDKTARLWDVATGKELLALRGHEGAVSSARFSADGKTVLTASFDKTARLWDVASGKELHALRGHEGDVTSARFSADGKTVLTASFDKTARLWDVASGKELRALRGHEGVVSSARFSADGKTVLTESFDKTARLWDAASGKELLALRGHEGEVTSARFSADGKTVLTASWDQTARLWDAASGKALRVLRGHEGEVSSARFSADGKTVLTASGDQSARLWDCVECRPVEELAPEVAGKIGRTLTEDERRQYGLPSVPAGRR